MNNSMNEDPTDIAAAAIKSHRDALPTYFIFKIQSFSLFASTSMDKFKSNDFEAEGYKWRLVFYRRNPQHISMYLKIVGPVGTDSTLPRGWVVDASFRFSVLDQIRNKYSILGDMGGRTKRFNEINTKWGYNQLVPLTTLNDSSNGYLVDDTCVFGAEVVLPRKSTSYGDCLTMVKSPSCVKFTWIIENFSRLKETFINSDVFYTQEHKWNIRIFPKGESRESSQYFSLYLYLLVDDSSINKEVYARFSFRFRDQLHNFHNEFEDERWFSTSLKDDDDDGWGDSEFMRLDELNDQSKGYLVNDTCIIEVEVTVLGTLKKLS